MTTADGTGYVGQYRDGNPHGDGKAYTFADGTILDGRLWAFIASDVDGHIVGVDGGERGVLDGRQRQGVDRVAGSGDYYTGEIKDGKRHGEGTFTFEHGNTYVGQWKDDKKHRLGNTRDGQVPRRRVGERRTKSRVTVAERWAEMVWVPPRFLRPIILISPSSSTTTAGTFFSFTLNVFRRSFTLSAAAAGALGVARVRGEHRLPQHLHLEAVGVRPQLRLDRALPVEGGRRRRRRGGAAALLLLCDCCGRQSWCPRRRP